MALFGIGNILLKVKRKKLPRPEKATWLSVFIAIIAVVFALVGNIIMEPAKGLPSNLSVFLEYFIPTIIFIIIMLNRTVLLKLMLSVMHSVFDPIRKFVLMTDKRIMHVVHEINNQEFVFFTKGDNIATLNKVMLYITKNEHTKKMKIVLVLPEGEKIPEHLSQEIDFLDREYPEIEIEFIVEKGIFTPEIIRKLSEKWDIPINFMFIGSPSNKFPYKIEELGGVRLII
jgi:Na+-translocating ferredoxin:NAD+ oxidoreductase RnfE subunit